MIAENMVQLGQCKQIIREIAAYAGERRAVVGADNVFDFSIGNPSLPAPPRVNATIRRLLDEMDSVALHGYTAAVGDNRAPVSYTHLRAHET